MRRSSTDANLTSSPKRSTSSRLTIATIVLFGIASTPLVLECINLYYAKWSAILGKSADERTPILDSIHDGLLTMSAELSRFVSPSFWNFLNHPSVVLTAAAIALVIGMIVLRNSGHSHS